MMSRKPRILISQGDPNGIGPEILLKIYNNTNLFNQFAIEVIGCKEVFRYYSDLYRLKTFPGIIQSSTNNFTPNPGKLSIKAGESSYDAFVKSIKLCLNKKFDALVTMPVNKENICRAGIKFNGHTGVLTKKASPGNSEMIMYSKEVCIAAATEHIPVKNISKTITQEYLTHKIISLRKFLTKIQKTGKIAVLGINPHAGDGGFIGKEEIEIIQPVLSKNKSLNADGPFSADAFFGTQKYKQYSGVLAMYHDQGLIPFKILSKGTGVNYTEGLYFPRTSPAHGTAFDIAGQNKAGIESTVEAIKLAAKLSG